MSRLLAVLYLVMVASVQTSFAIGEVGRKGNGPHPQSQKVMVLDSLRSSTDLGELVERTYRGATCCRVKKKYSLTIYNYKHSGDGVFEMVVRTRGGRVSKIERLQGRMYTLRGDAYDPDATVYQFIPFVGSGGTGAVNFLYKGSEIELLDSEFKRKEGDETLSLMIVR